MSDMSPVQPIQQAGQLDYHVLRSGKYTGLKVKLLPVQPMLVNKVMTSVEIPKRPTYETKSVSGRVQNLPMDEKAAKETPGGETLWLYYQEETERALTEQNNRVVNAILVMGTEFEVPEDGWDTIQELMGLDVPKIPALRRAHFLMTVITDPTELNELMSKIMRLTGVSEEVLAQAEGTFQRSVRDQPEGQQPMANTRTDSGQAPAW